MMLNWEPLSAHAQQGLMVPDVKSTLMNVHLILVLMEEAV